jgi:transcriptional regulator with XRE-family HTH domain
MVKDVGTIDKIIGEKISKLRISRGLSRQDLAKKLGITHQQLQKYEKGINRISVGRLVDVSEKLKAPITYFFDNNNEFLGLDSSNQRLATEIMKDFLKIKNPEQQEAIKKLIKAMVEQGV